MSVALSVDSFPYIVACGNCRHDFNAMTAHWCRCVTRETSVACSRCGWCVCRDGRIATRDFWLHAPALLHERRAKERERRSSVPALAEATRPKVLLVDDDEEIRLIGEFALREIGYRTAAASSSKEALAMVQREKPAVVITDALMPGGDGRELCKTIKMRHPGVKVVVMTSLYTSSRYASEAFRLFHADGYLAKPIDFDRLRSLVKRLAP